VKAADKFTDEVQRIVTGLLRRKHILSLDSVKAAEQIMKKRDAYLASMKKNNPTLYLMQASHIRLMIGFIITNMHRWVNEKQTNGSSPAAVPARKRKKAE
jgi:hypothetical protein